MSGTKERDQDIIVLSSEELALQLSAGIQEEGQDEDGASVRVYKSLIVKRSLSAIAIFMSLYHIYVLLFKLTTPLATFAVHWGLGLTLLFFYYPFTKGGRRKNLNLADIVCILSAIAITVYIVTDAKALAERSAYLRFSQLDMIFGAVAILITLEAARRCMGLGLPIISIVLVAYALWGNHLPGEWACKGYSLKRFISYTFSNYGLFGTPIKMSTQYIFLMVLFGAFLHISGCGNALMNLAMSAFGSRRGGPAKVSVMSSCFFGSISGSAVANVVGTGVLTIPMMKKAGYKSEFAGAVEAVASTGGQIMPPIMGSGAFIMAELLGVKYTAICFAALAPALLYYMGLYVAVDLEAGKNDLKSIDTSQMDRVMTIVKRDWYQFLPIFALIICMVFFRMTIAWAAVMAIVVLLLATAFTAARMSLHTILEALELGALRSLSIVACCACAGIAIAAVNLTGLGMKFTLMVTSLAGGSLFLSLLLAALAATVLGMGLPTVAAYIIAASVLGGALSSLGLPPLVAHMFLFYYSLLSQITPPVALAAYAAGNIANANPMKVGFLAMRLGAVAFVLPFFIAYGPALIGIGTPAEIILAVVTAFVGVFCFTAGQFGWLMGENMNIISRILLIGTSMLLVIPGIQSDLIGLGGIAAGLLLHKPVRDRFSRKTTETLKN